MPVLNLLGAVVLAALGALLWSLAVRAIRLRRAMKRWPVLPGVVRDHRRRGSRQATFVDFQVSYRFAERDHLAWCTSPTRAGFERPEPHMIALMVGGGTLLMTLAVAATPWVAGSVSDEAASLAFMLVLGAVLSALAISMSIALFRVYFPPQGEWRER